MHNQSNPSTIVPPRNDRHDAPPRILFVSDHLGHAGGRIHGATRYFLTVLPRLQRAGLHIDAVFLREAHPEADTLRAAGIEPVFLNCSKYDFTAFLALRRILQDRNIRIIHASGLKGMLMARLAAGRRPLLLHLHDMVSVRPAFLAPLLGAAFRRADTILCVSDAVHRFAREHLRLPPAKLLTLRNGIPLSPPPAPDAPAVRREFNLPPEGPLLLAVGRLDATKNPDAVLEAFVHIAASHPNASLLIIGEGERRPALQRSIRKHRLEPRAVLAGQREDLPRLLAAADLMLAAPRSEGLGLAAIEALAAGCPVLATRVGGLAEVVRDGINGRLLPPGDPAAMARAALQLLRDPQTRRAYSEAALTSARAFDIDTHIQRLRDLYRESLK